MRQTRPHLPAPRRTLERRVTGTPEHVAATVRRLRSSGRLLAMTEPRQATDGRIWVDVRFLEGTRTAAPARRRRWPIAAAAAGGVAVAGVGVYALVQLVNAAIRALPYIGGGLLLLALAALLSPARQRVVCVTMHGPGCRHH
ncbi:hypothetical protein ACGFI9_37145 [Micromonospora sp. NPDC048930]|uniref:hypothetical protein n=1 Tax=Micromonospora sp. NPDC048930 TaxID=3364261 RepID=UPI003716B93D